MQDPISGEDFRGGHHPNQWLLGLAGVRRHPDPACVLILLSGWLPIARCLLVLLHTNSTRQWTQTFIIALLPVILLVHLGHILNKLLYVMLVPQSNSLEQQLKQSVKIAEISQRCSPDSRFVAIMEQA